ncbi:PrsW family intramembrane metalloprotease [Planosporangium thailandense]|uniref:PrsW family intramembrane metalloprotease n=1 Tax=Planosporangium thailandense TaxID=765197 RepID=A0ABX0Y063_9ACTN|nr:PrsW family glutamic-type intramembrane protease [Planosporangium thailandense]NJC70789.1 PrsW family intramembrane metalloprotease [Planosporangium thailandense]
MTTVGTPRRVQRRAWLRIFTSGLLLWVLTVAVTFVTGNPNLVPTLVLLGSFLVPVTFVAWAFERRDTGEINAELILNTFITGGVLGVLAASLLEQYLLHPSPGLFFGVGLIEEGVKLVALAWLTRRLHVKSVRDGMILGASVGFGFAAFESAGYAFTALFTEHGLSLMQLVETELLRGLLSPVGHGLWTAILGGVLFSPSTREHFLLSGRLFVAYLGVSLLHALWDSMHQIAMILTLLWTGTAWQYNLLARGYLPQPTETQVRLMTFLDWAGLIVVAVVGVGWLLFEWYRAPRSRPPTAAWRISTGNWATPT